MKLGLSIFYGNVIWVNLGYHTGCYVRYLHIWLPTKIETLIINNCYYNNNIKHTMLNILVYTNDGKYMVINDDYTINNLTAIQDDLANIYPKQVYNVGSRINHNYYFVLDINNYIHAIITQDVDATLQKYLCKTLGNNTTIMHVFSASSCDICITMINVGETTVIYDVFVDLLSNGQLDYKNSAQLSPGEYKQSVALHNVINEYATLKQPDGTIMCVNINGRHMSVPQNYENIVCHNIYSKMIEYLYNGIFQVKSDDVMNFPEVSFDMVKHKIKSYYYHPMPNSDGNHMLLLINENNDAFMYVDLRDRVLDSMDNFTPIGKIIGDYHAIMLYDRLVIVQPNKVRCVTISYDIGLLEDIVLMDNEIVCTHGYTFKGYTWTKQNHKYLSLDKQTIVKTFVICNKMMGKFRVPYWLLCKIFTFIYK